MFIGIMPAGGLGTRLHPLKYPKELLPVAYVADESSGLVRPVLVAEYALSAMREADIVRCVMIITERKMELLRYISDGAHLGVSVAYVHEPEPRGVAAAVDAAFSWIADANVCFAVPDTVFFPRDALSTIKQTLLQQGADLVLGVFPT